MTLLDDVRASIRRPGGTCSVATLLGALPADEATELSAVLTMPELPASAIAAALRRRGHALAEQNISRHRRRSCVCPA